MTTAAVVPLAHAGHWAVDLLTVLPVLLLIIWFAIITVRDRRRRPDPAESEEPDSS
jgi:hypothetical protein